MVIDLHLPEDWDMGADPFRELWHSQVPILYSMTIFVTFIVVKASATVGRDSRIEAVARAKSSA